MYLLNKAIGNYSANSHGKHHEKTYKCIFLFGKPFNWRATNTTLKRSNQHLFIYKNALYRFSRPIVAKWILVLWHICLSKVSERMMETASPLKSCHNYLIYPSYVPILMAGLPDFRRHRFQFATTECHYSFLDRLLPRQLLKDTSGQLQCFHTSFEKKTANPTTVLNGNVGLDYSVHNLGIISFLIKKSRFCIFLYGCIPWEHNMNIAYQ